MVGVADECEAAAEETFVAEMSAAVVAVVSDEEIECGEEDQFGNEVVGVERRELKLMGWEQGCLPEAGQEQEWVHHHHLWRKVSDWLRTERLHTNNLPENADSSNTNTPLRCRGPLVVAGNAEAEEVVCSAECAAAGLFGSGMSQGESLLIEEGVVGGAKKP